MGLTIILDYVQNLVGYTKVSMFSVTSKCFSFAPSFEIVDGNKKCGIRSMVATL